MKKKPLAFAIGSVLFGMSLPGLAGADDSPDSVDSDDIQLNSTEVARIESLESDDSDASTKTYSLEEVVVTGSRIRRDTLASALR